MKTSILLFGLLLLASCQNAANKVVKHGPETEGQQKTAPADSFVRRTVISSVASKTQAGETYALYLPANYNEDTARPAILFFHPQADGAYPLKQYSELAENYSYIMLGSNNSKNGLTAQQTLNYAKNLVTEALTRFNVNKVYMCGFSGGAKVALMAGSQLEQVEAVVYCGAMSTINPSHPLKILGFAGTGDMNYTDLVQYHRELNHPQIENYMIEWPGRHEFPDATAFDDAFKFLNTGKVPDYHQKQPTLSPKELMTEQITKQQYLLAIQKENLEWWQHKTDSLKNSPDMRSQRLLGFVSLISYSLTEQGFKQKNRPMIERILAIYRMADPENEALPGFEARLQNLK
jgi:predicted esterase